MRWTRQTWISESNAWPSIARSTSGRNRLRSSSVLARASFASQCPYRRVRPYFRRKKTDQRPSLPVTRIEQHAPVALLRVREPWMTARMSTLCGILREHGLRAFIYWIQVPSAS